MQNDSMDKTGKRVAIAIFVALVVDGMNLQMLALTLPDISRDMKLAATPSRKHRRLTNLTERISGHCQFLI